jgi:predicted 3-demethylubiquinone-9 3-methyltransferase (glyoxalase superfamily)
MQKVTTFLMFPERGAEAVRLYTSVIKGARLASINVIEDGPEKGKLMQATFEIDGQQFNAMDGGDYFSFSQGISLSIACETQEEIDELWEKLSEGGEKQQCGWVVDRFGVSWQIIPANLGELLWDGQPEKSQRVMDALLKMHKLDMKQLQEAYEQG